MSAWTVGEATPAEREVLRGRERELFGADSALRAEWLFDRNPAGRALVLVARDPRGAILGTRALLPWRLLVEGRQIRVGQYARTWTEPSARRLGVSVAIGRELNRRSVELGYPMLFLFPSVRSIPGHRTVGNRLVETLERRQVLGSLRFFTPCAPGWLDEPLARIRRRRVHLSGPGGGPAGMVPQGIRAAAGPRGTPAWVPDPEPARTAARFWNERTSGPGVIGVRDAAFVSWRYSPESGREYVAWRYPDAGPARLLAFLHRAGRRARLLDIWGPAEADERAAAVAALVEAEVARGAHLVEWCPPRHGDDPSVADRAGFFRRRGGVPLGIWFSSGAAPAGSLNDPESYRLTEGDSDYA